MRRWGWACVLGLMLAGCKEDKAPEAPDAGPVETGPAALTEKEPNDRPDQALDITRNSTVSAELTAQPNKADEDWYRLAPGAPRIADVTVSGLPGGDITLEVYDRDRNRLVGVNSEGEGKPERFPNLYVENERFIRVVPSRKGVGGAYTLEVRMRAPEDGEEREPNDRAVDAVSLSLGQTVTAYLGHAGDEDWYRIELPDPTQPSAPQGAGPGGTAEDPSTAPFGDSPSQGTPSPGDGTAPQGMGGTLPGAGGAGAPLGQDDAMGGGLAGQQGTTGAGAQNGQGNPRAGAAGARQDLTGNGFETEEGAAPRGTEEDGTPGLTAQEGRRGASPGQGGVDGFARDEAPPSPAVEGTFAGSEPPPVGSQAVGEAIARALDAGTAVPVPPEPPSVALKIELTGVDGVRPELSVLSAAEAPLFTLRGKEGETLSLRNIGVRAMDRVVYVVVKTSWVGTGKEARRPFNTTMPYTLTVSQEEAGASAELEPNDELHKATTVTAGGYREGFLAPKGDVDHFVLKTSEPVLAKVELTGVERLDLVLSMVEPPEGESGKETVLLRANDGAIKEPERLNNVACNGACYFRVEGASRKVDGKWVKDFENAEQPYRITVTTVPDNGGEEREPNNTADRAQDLTLGQPVRGTVYPVKDTDFFRLDLSDRPVRTPIRATLLGILKVDVGLYLHRVQPDGKLSLVQTADRAKGDQPESIRYSAEPGVYLFEVRDARNRESNFQDSYQLTVEESE
ncbi:ABC transporter substrate-binding protein [Myxococcus sp. NMCA1]|uniref:ABC transporter substrate-binding protein n=1 Tax=Myxococcus sp. NMCA1 TaxID=2996785 RepID=UPI002285D5C1|nr:ABC transporter substrate-binding protein [Myxococcus sp. NMCA1]WAM23989.1 ABC transporter substrate-binding protein [Myxococcus sp. NMCA1]